MHLRIFIYLLIFFKSIRKYKKKQEKRREKTKKVEKPLLNWAFLILLFFKSQPHIIVSNSFFNYQQVYYK